MAGGAYDRRLRQRQRRRHSGRPAPHVGYKVAVELGPRYLGVLERHAGAIARNVTENLYERHIRPLFFGE